MRERIGGLRGSFTREDLIADMDAQIVAGRLADDSSRPLSDIVRELRHASLNDPTWRPRTFWDERFGSRATATAAVQQVVAPTTWLVAAAEWSFLRDFRFPGEPDSPVDGVVVPQDELNQEVSSMVRATVDEFEHLVSHGL